MAWVMRGCHALALCSVVLTGTLQSASAYPIPVYMPDIEYPESLRRSSERFSIDMRILIRKDGSVRFTALIDSNDPVFISTTKATVERWRFQPWTPPATAPEGPFIKAFVSEADRHASVMTLLEAVPTTISKCKAEPLSK